MCVCHLLLICLSFLSFTVSIHKSIAGSSLYYFSLEEWGCFQVCFDSGKKGKRALNFSLDLFSWTSLHWVSYWEKKKSFAGEHSSLRVCVALSSAHPVTLPVCKLGMILSSPWLCLASKVSPDSPDRSHTTRNGISISPSTSPLLLLFGFRLVLSRDIFCHSPYPVHRLWFHY